jgi:hypothetical protein
MTRAKSLLSNVTLLVRPGLEPKIARFGGPHGVSCGRGLNPRHGPLQVWRALWTPGTYIYCRCCWQCSQYFLCRSCSLQFAGTYMRLVFNSAMYSQPASRRKIVNFCSHLDMPMNTLLSRMPVVSFRLSHKNESVLLLPSNPSTCPSLLVQSTYFTSVIVIS